MEVKETILILMATYNGENYITEQIESILSQTHTNFKLFISDDLSQDRTVEIIKEFMKKDNRIYLFEHNENMGALKNFNFLINKAKERKENYIMFCDQDDVWKNNKIEISLKKLQEEENLKITPLMLYTNKEIVNEKLESLKIKEKEFDLSYNSLNFLIHQNAYYGCTMIINRELLKLLEEEIPKEIVYHDHYISLITYIYGKTIYLDEKTMFYRQHGNNISTNLNRKFGDKFLKVSKLSRHVKLFFSTAEYLKERHIFALNKKDKKMIEEICKNKNRTFILWTMLKYRIKRTSLLGTLNFYIQLMLGEIDD